MSDFLTRLAERALGAAPSLRPWTPSVFERATEAMPQEAVPSERMVLEEMAETVPSFAAVQAGPHPRPLSHRPPATGRGAPPPGHAGR